MGVSHMDFQEEVCPEPICLHPLAWLQVPNDHLAFVLGPLHLPWRGLSNALRVWEQWGQGQWAVARGSRVWSSWGRHLPPTWHPSAFGLNPGSSASCGWSPRPLCTSGGGCWGSSSCFLAPMPHGPPHLPITPDQNAWDTLSSSQLNSAHLPFSQINVGKLRPKEWKEGLRCSSAEWCGLNSNDGSGGQVPGRNHQSQQLRGSMGGAALQASALVGTVPRSRAWQGH